MKIKMTSYSTGKNYALRPGDIHDFPEKEALRIIEIGGGVAATEEDEADKSQDDDK